MARKLKTYRTSSGFFDLAVAASREHEIKRIEKDRAVLDRRSQPENALGQAEGGSSASSDRLDAQSRRLSARVACDTLSGVLTS